MDTTVVLVPKSIPIYVFPFTCSLASGSRLKRCVSVKFLSISNELFYYSCLPKRNYRYNLFQSHYLTTKINKLYKIKKRNLKNICIL